MKKDRIIHKLIQVAKKAIRAIPIINEKLKEQKEIYVRDLWISQQEITKEIKIGLISDIHLGENTSNEVIRRVLKEMIKREIKGLIILGDLIDEKIEDLKNIKIIREEIKEIPIYFIPGNHDHMVDPNLEKITEILKNEKIEIIINKSIKLSGSYGNIYIDCLDDPIRGNPNFTKLYHKEKEKLLLCHAPEILAWGSLKEWDIEKMKEKGLIQIDKEGNKEYKYDEKAIITTMTELNYNKAIFGHTHGGQIKKIGKIALNKEGYSYQFTNRFNQFKGKEIHITTGVGNSGLPIRIGTNPEGLILRFHQRYH